MKVGRLGVACAQGRCFPLSPPTTPPTPALPCLQLAAQQGSPVVSVSIGDSCDFLYKDDPKDVERGIVLSSGSSAAPPSPLGR